MENLAATAVVFFVLEAGFIKKIKGISA